MCVCVRVHPSQAANLQGVKMLCTNAEGASLRGCNFEDPAGIKANLEGEAADHTFFRRTLAGEVFVEPM